ncbi:Leucine rich repeat-containing protein [Lachnospiraceae bacterium G11]|nr:Leucine rich repeat-containing protein [Lachnospiraceae bacterium G11]
MAKKAKSRMNRKTKRIIRRCIAGLLMVTAIGVAAIPAKPVEADSASIATKRTKVIANAAADPTYSGTISYVSGTTAADLPLKNSAKLDATLYEADGTTETADYKVAAKAKVGPTMLDLYPIFTISGLSSGKPEIKWQFKYYDSDIGGIIACYNDEYRVNHVTLPNNGVRSYAIVSENMYKSFYTGTNPGNIDYVLSHADYRDYKSTGTKNNNTKRFEKYFNAEYQNFWNKCIEYDEYLVKKDIRDKWEARRRTWVNQDPTNNHEADYATSQNDPEPEIAVFSDTSGNWNGDAPNVSISVKPSESFGSSTSADALKKAFYCDIMLADYGTGFSLVKINDRVGYYEVYNYDPATGVYTKDTDSSHYETVGSLEIPKIGAPLSSSEMHEVYVVSTEGATVTDGTSVDGYLALRISPNINGIANRGFKDVKNVEILSLPSETKYIGDEAFINSFIKEINFSNVEDIGNRAFKECSSLSTVNLGSGTTTIGTDAFYGSAIRTLKVPVSVKVIGPGAFAECTSLSSIDFSELETGNCDIRDYAFFNDAKIGNVNFPGGGIMHLGEGAFAVTSSVSGGWTNIVLPGSINKIVTEWQPQTHTGNDYGYGDGKVDGLGNYLFAGRSNIKSVRFPDNYSNANATSSEDDIALDSDYKLDYSKNLIPAGIFKGCTGLQYIEFPNTSAYPTFHPYTFLDVDSKDFYIKGPMSKADGKAAYPRQCTWQAITKGSNFVPYIYIDSTGKENYEVSDGTYLLLASPDGTLTGCTLIPPKATELDMVIPAKVGDYDIKRIASDCFDDDIRGRIKTLTIADDSVTEISPNAFANMPILSEVVIGNSVETIGEKAFSNCDDLTYVKIGDGTKTIGNSAFEECDKLAKVEIGSGVTRVGDKTFFNCKKLYDIAFASPKDGYGALSVGTDAFKTNGSELTLTGDIQGGYALFDWAMDKDNYIDEHLGTRVFYRSPKPSSLGVIYDNNSGEVTLVDYPKFNDLDTTYEPYCREMEQYFYNLYSADEYNSYREQFDALWEAATDDAAREDAYNSQWYGPWIYDNGSPDNKKYKTGGLNSSGVYEQGIGTIETADSYFDHVGNAYSIKKNYTTKEKKGEWETPSPKEQELVKATLNVVVPAGVTSIDIQDFINGSTANSTNVQKYLKNLPGYAMYSDKSAVPDGVPGLFSGYYQDFASGSPDEKAIKGNDSIKSVTLTSVKKLPDYCFDSCEGLETVNIGSDCSDIGTAPFRGCDNISVVGGNDNYKYNNGIIYSVNDDGTYTIEECLSSRGKVVGKSIIDETNDPDLANVSAIKDGAFDNCDKLSNVDLSSAEKLKEIPATAFNDCDELAFVELPESVNQIKSKAFTGDHHVTVTIPGKEVDITTDSFEHESSVKIRTYEDSAAARYAQYHGLSLEIIGQKFRVLFYDYDGKQLGEAQYVESGKSAEEPTPPKHDGMTFTGWSDSPHNVTKDLILIAQYSGGNGGSVSGGDAGNNGSGNGGSGSGGSGSGGSGGSGSGGSGSGGSGDSSGIYRVTVINGSGSGDYLAGRSVTITANTSNGKTFSNWSSNDGVAFANSTSATTTFTMPAKNVTVTAYYTTSGSVSGNNNGANRNNAAGTTGTRVAINKPGISNTNLASAKVNGSTDDFIVKISETPEATAAVERALTNEYGSLDGLKYFAMDITLWDSNGATKITDTTGLSVDITIPLPDSLKDYAGNNKTAAVVNDYLEPLTPKFTTIDKVPCVTFRATHFSPYAIYVDTGNLSEGTRPDGTPKTADGIHPKWFLSIGLAALSLILFFKRDNKVRIKNI